MLAIPNPQISNVRQAIARRHCRVVTAIDDRLMEDVDKRVIDQRFFDLWQSCEENGIACHLHHYPQIDVEPEDEQAKPKVEKALSLAEIADVLVLDWNLGQNNPTHAIYLLDKLGRKRIRFVVIYTAETAPESVEEDLKAKFLDQLQPLIIRSTLEGIASASSEQPLSIQPVDPPPPVPATEPDGAAITAAIEGDVPVDEDDEGEIVTGALATIIADSFEEGSVQAAQTQGSVAPLRRINCHLDNKVFIFIRTKDDVMPKQLLEEIYSCMAQTFPDHLHWAGLEAAAEAREIFPAIIAALPSGADAALLYQLLFQEEDDVAQQIAEVLADELKFQLQLRPLSAVCDAELEQYFNQHITTLSFTATQLNDSVRGRYPKIWDARCKTLQQKRKTSQALTEEDTRTQAQIDLIERVAMTHPTLRELRGSTWQNRGNCSCTEAQGEFCEIELNAIFKTIVRKELKKVQALESHVAWATARESVLIPPITTQLEPGYVLRRKSINSPEPEWLLCVTSACDCLRPSGVGYQFVEGRTRDQDQTASEGGQTQSCIVGQEVVWDASEMRPRPNPTERSSEGTEPQYELVSSLRLSFSARVIHRVYSHKSRVGVDTSQFLHERRDER